MRVGSVGDYIVISRAFAQGTMWGCAFKIRKTDRSFQTTSDIQGETVCDETFDSRAEAEGFAFSEGEAVVKSFARNF